jgi:hypothetical protein
MDDNEMLTKAITTHTQYRLPNGAFPVQPNVDLSEVIQGRDGKFVVLRNVNGLLAIYRYNGSTKRLRKVGIGRSLKWMADFEAGLMEEKKAT